MTAEILSQIEGMNRKGLNDEIIAEKIFCGTSTVRKWRKVLGLPIAGVNRTKRRYALYDGKTTQYIMEGTARECAAYMGVKVETFRSAKVRFEHGRYKKYEIYEVDDD